MKVPSNIQYVYFGDMQYAKHLLPSTCIEVQLLTLLYALGRLLVVIGFWCINRQLIKHDATTTIIII